VVGFGAGFVVDGTGTGVRGATASAATDVSAAAVGIESGARLPETGMLVMAGGTATGAAPAHPVSIRAVATATTLPAVVNSVVVNS
jgi:hypothetical protein